MRTRLLAAVLSCGGFAWGQPTSTLDFWSPFFRPVRVGLVITFEHQPDRHFLGQLRREIERIFRPTGLDLHWEQRDPAKPAGVYDHLVIIEMRGRCSNLRPVELSGTLDRPTNLGWTLVNDGEVIPHSVVDCDQIARATRNMQPAFQDRRLLPFYYMRLTGRVVGHELVHALLRRPEHHHTDFGRSPLREDELQTDARLASSEVAALRQLGRPPSGTTIAGGNPKGHR